MAWCIDRFGDHLNVKDGDTIVKKSTDEILQGKKLIGVYFSAHWCPPCRSFTPVLAKFYEDMKELDESHMEIIFVSSDSDEASFEHYFGTQPWKALPLRDSHGDDLSKQLNVRGIPTFVVLNGETGELIDREGRTTVSRNPDVETALKIWCK